MTMFRRYALQKLFLESQKRSYTPKREGRPVLFRRLLRKVTGKKTSGILMQKQAAAVPNQSKQTSQ